MALGQMFQEKVVRFVEIKVSVVAYGFQNDETRARLIDDSAKLVVVCSRPAAFQLFNGVEVSIYFHSSFINFNLELRLDVICVRRCNLLPIGFNLRKFQKFRGCWSRSIIRNL